LANLKPQLLATNAMKLKQHEALLRVSAVGLNFRDVLNVLGMYPGDPGPPGGDFAGTVLAVGGSMSHLAPGKHRCLLPYHATGSADVCGTASSCTDTSAALQGGQRQRLCASRDVVAHVRCPPPIAAEHAGDRVFGQAAGCLGSHVVADARALAPLPCELGPLAGSTLPTAHLTAAAALLDAAHVCVRDR